MFAKHAIAALLLANVSAKSLEDDTRKHQAMAVIEGLLLGVGIEQFGDITKCAVDAEKVLGDAEHAVKDFERMNSAGVKAGLTDIADAIGDVLVLAHNCKSLNIKGEIVRLEALAEMFSNPVTLEYHIGKDLLVNGKSIYKDVRGSIVAWKNEEYFTFGKDIGDAAAKLILGNEPAIHLPKLPVKQIVGVLHGFLTETLAVDHLKELNTCLKDAEHVGSGLYYVIEDFKLKNIQSIISGIQKLGYVLVGLPKDYGDCTNLQGDLAKVAKWAKQTAADPAMIGKNVWANLPAIYDDINTLTTDFPKEKYDDAGSKAADILVLALGKVGAVEPSLF